MKEMTMTKPSPVFDRRWVRMFGLNLALGLALIANLGDRALSASAANSGIDPLEVLNLQIRNNALIVLDSSGSMRDATSYAVAGGNATNFAALELVGDDPRAKLESAKQVLKKIIKNNETKVSFQFGRYEEGNDYSQPGLNSNKFVYTCSTVATPPEVPCTAAAANIAFNFSGFTRALADQHVDRLPAPPAVPGTNATFFALYNDAYRVNRLYRIGSGGALCASTPDTAITTGAWAPPPTPSDWNNPNAVGYTGPPFFDIQRFTTNTTCTGASTTARFYFRGGEWNKGNNGGQTCGGFKSLTPLADCTVNSQLSLVAPFILPEFIPTTTNNATVASLRASTGNAIRASGFTPIAETLIDMRTIFAVDKDLVIAGVQPPLWSTISTQTPTKQRTFVIFLTDGDDTCPSSTTTGGAAIDNALRTAHKAQVLRQGIANSGGAGIVDPASRVEVFMIAFGGSVSPEINYAAWGGSGMVRPSTGADTAASTRWSTAPTQTDRNNCITCRDALPAADTSQLEQALQAAIDVGSATGEYSDQQSVTETVFEFAPAPGDPEDRYSVSVPILLQSTFELPDYKGHLNAFRRAGTASLQVWDAGQRLQDRIEEVSTGMGPTGVYTFGQLHNNAGNLSSLNALKTNGMKIKRRIFTTTQNGVNANYNPNNLINANFASLAGVSGGFRRVALWPPSVGTSNNAFVAPNPNSDLGVNGILDSAMGFDNLTTVALVQAAVTGACQASPSGGVVPPDCTSGTAGVALARAKREAREIVLAYIAGARLVVSGGLPIRASTGNPRELQYVVRPWLLAESTLAAPAVVTAPLLAGPLAGGLGADEYKYYRDGTRTSTGAPINGVMNGLGLRNPDRLVASASQSLKDAAAANPDIKPVMSVIYHATNQGLHAFRAGPCPSSFGGGGLGASSLACMNGPGTNNTAPDGTPLGEIGGEELWVYVPHDLLAKLPKLTKTQTRTNKQYLLAAPVRFSDIFVPGAGTLPTGSSPAGSVSGVWRTILFFGRGQGGNFYSAVDVTTPGPFTKHSLDTEPPIVVWNRGNPDTARGQFGGSAINGAVDTAAYAKMGETWSVPAVGFVRAADYPTARKPSGTDFVLFTGSGYSDVVAEGKTFYALDALTGDVARSFDIPNGSAFTTPLPLPTPLPSPAPPTVMTNFLVASPVLYAQNPAPDASYNLNSPSGYSFFGNAIAVKAKTVYFGDLHSRIWRYDVTTPGVAPTVFFAASTSGDGHQPFATAVSVVQNRPNYTDLTDPGEILIYAESGFDRRVMPQAAKPFKAYAFRDNNGVAVPLFVRDFLANYRGNVQPAASFTLTPGASAGTFSLPANPVVFYAGTRFNPPVPPPPCISSFDSILIALRGSTTATAAAGDAAFDLRATGDDSYIELIGSRVNAIRVSPNEGNLVIDQGLNAQVPPPPPGVPVPPVTTSSSSSLVNYGLVPGTQAYADLSATTVPFRIGSSVCRIQP